jgi:hypothetical protein
MATVRELAAPVVFAGQISMEVLWRRRCLVDLPAVARSGSSGAGAPCGIVAGWADGGAVGVSPRPEVENPHSPTCVHYAFDGYALCHNVRKGIVQMNKLTRRLLTKRRSGFAFISPPPFPPIGWVWVMVVFLFLVIVAAAKQALLRPAQTVQGHTSKR